MASVAVTKRVAMVVVGENLEGPFLACSACRRQCSVPEFRQRWLTVSVPSLASMSWPSPRRVTYWC